jgi:hypothetical protein
MHYDISNLTFTVLLHCTVDITLATRLLQTKHCQKHWSSYAVSRSTYNSAQCLIKKILIFLSYIAFILGEVEEQQHAILLHLLPLARNWEDCLELQSSAQPYLLLASCSERAVYIRSHFKMCPALTAVVARCRPKPVYDTQFSLYYKIIFRADSSYNKPHRQLRNSADNTVSK